ncbi:MAG: isoprenylcysteine carboxylmethyltransferase family protein, partial [Candidatus Aminicenantes bacterium]|nr:isoprenylcysteine carboxylmethyltransferase family protein [Candidatus Aminicenantes bacterium]
VVAGDALFLVGYALFVLVLRENSYASHVVEIEQKQKVITTGPYAAVRHPMYSALALIYGFSPLALGSYWALIPFGLMILILAIRLLDEEKFLLRELDGYREYTQKTRYRLIPGVW